MELQEGLFRISPKIYHSLPGLSYTGIKDFQRSPAHFLAALAGQKEETTAMKFGSAYHAFLLENQEFRKEFAVRPSNVSSRTKEGQAWSEENANKSIITQDEMDKISGMARVLWEHPQWRIFSPGSEREIAMIWHDKQYDVWCRTRIDLLQPALRVPVDLKTSVDARPVPFLSAAFRLGYHIQAAWTLRGLEAVTGNKHQSFVFIVQEKEEPYQISVYEATEEFVMQGNAEINDVIPAYAECLHSGVFPGYDPAIKPLSLPSWLKEEVDEHVD